TEPSRGIGDAVHPACAKIQALRQGGPPAGVRCPVIGPGTGEVIEELAYWLAFTRVLGVGPSRLRRLLDHFGTLAEAWAAGPGGWIRAGIEPKVAENIAERRKTIDPERELARLRASNYRAITWDDPEYPRRLAEIYAPPPLLFLKGELERD